MSRLRAAGPHPTRSPRSQVEGERVWNPHDEQRALTGPSLHIILGQVNPRDRVVPAQIHSEIDWALPLQHGGCPLLQTASDSLDVVQWELAPFNLRAPCTEPLLSTSQGCRDE